MPPSTRTLLASRSTIGDLPAGSFSAIPASALHLLDAVSLRVSLAAGVTVFEEGARAGRVYFVCSGRVKLFTASRDGRIFVFRFARAGDLLGSARRWTARHLKPPRKPWSPPCSRASLRRISSVCL